jgi:hypothetical protein
MCNKFISLLLFLWVDIYYFQYRGYRYFDSSDIAISIFFQYIENVNKIIDIQFFSINFIFCFEKKIFTHFIETRKKCQFYLCIFYFFIFFDGPKKFYSLFINSNIECRFFDISDHHLILI